MIALADAEEAPKGHHRIGNLAGYLVDHDAVDRTKMLPLQVIHRGPDDHVGGLVSSAATVVPAIDVCVCIITLGFKRSLQTKRRRSFGGSKEPKALFTWLRVRHNTSLPVFPKKEDSRANNGA